MIQVPRIASEWSRFHQALVPLCLPFALLPLRPALPNSGLQSPHETATVVAWWRFQNGVKGTAAAPDHLIEDASGNDQHGLAVGRPRFRRVALPVGNLALEFTSDEQRVFVPDDEAFQLTGSLTIEAAPSRPRPTARRAARAARARPAGRYGER